MQIDCQLNTPIAETIKWIEKAEAKNPEQLSLLYFEENFETYYVLSYALKSMIEMGLGELPVKVISLSEPLNTILQRRFHPKVAKSVGASLSNYFPNSFVAALYELQFIFNKTQINAYLIGGLTRDMIISEERQFDIRDVDITIEGHVDALVSELLDVSKNFVEVEQYPKFGTAKMLYKNKIEFDFASTRQEIYKHCGALPEVSKLGVKLEEDIIRRDFTINALALSLNQSGQIIDSFGGLEDLSNGILRPLKSFTFFEDPTRAYRLLKFIGRLGFKAADETMYLLEQFMNVSSQVYKGGGERIKKELFSLLSLPETLEKRKALSLFTQMGLHRLIDTQLPLELDWPMPLEKISERIQRLEDQFENYWQPTTTSLIYVGLIMSCFSQNHQLHALDRLGLNKYEKEVAEEINLLTSENTVNSLSYHQRDSEIDRVFNPLHFASAAAGIVLSSQPEACAEALWHYKSQLEDIKCELSGLDIMALGVPAGEMIKKLLIELKGAKLDENLNSRWEEMQWLEGRIKQGV